MDVVLRWIIRLGLLAVLALVVVLLRRIRLGELQRFELSEDDISVLRLDLLDYVRMHSYTMGAWVKLRPFWKQHRVRMDGDRLRVLSPLLEEAVLLVEKPISGFQRMVESAVDWFGLPLPEQVVLPELVFRRMSQGEPLVIDNVVVNGDWVMGDQDNSTNVGTRAGGDIVGGDMVGHDKAGRDARGVHAGGSMSHSGNSHSSVPGSVVITTQHELAEALVSLAAEAQQRGSHEDTVDALLWAADAARSEDDPEPREAIRMQRILDKAENWVRTAFAAIVSGVAGGLADHWVVHLLHD